MELFLTILSGYRADIGLEEVNLSLDIPMVVFLRKARSRNLSLHFAISKFELCFPNRLGKNGEYDWGYRSTHGSEFSDGLSSSIVLSAGFLCKFLHICTGMIKMFV